jgi:hypothetical protein
MLSLLKVALFELLAQGNDTADLKISIIPLDT